MIKLFSVPHYLLKELTLWVRSFKTINKLKKWDELKTEFDLTENKKFVIAQITHALLSLQKEILRNYTVGINNLVIQDHHLIKKHQIFFLNKVNSSTLCEMLTDANKIKPTSQTYFENLFRNFKPDWKSIYLLTRHVTLDTNLRLSQYKLLNNFLYLNNMLFRFKKADSLSAHIALKKKKLHSTYFIPA